MFLRTVVAVSCLAGLASTRPTTTTANGGMDLTTLATLKARQEDLICPLGTLGGSAWGDKNCRIQLMGDVLPCFQRNSGCVDTTRMLPKGLGAIYVPYGIENCKVYFYPDGCGRPRVEVEAKR